MTMLRSRDVNSAFAIVVILISTLWTVPAFADDTRDPGFWKQPKHFGAWNVYAPQTRFSEVFGRSIAVRWSDKSRPQNVEDPTLLQALGARGGGDSALARNSVAALLNAVIPTAPSCTGLLLLELPWVTVVSAEEVAATSVNPSHCRFLGIIDTEITFEVALPAPERWNGKFLMGGGGGFLGDLNNGSKTIALTRGYATAVTDTGHSSRDFGATWAFNNLERQINFGHRGTHLAAANAKLVTQAYYDRAIQYSYFVGSSGSGRQAMMESQRYPKDFDGILAGVPAFNWTKGLGVAMAWTQQAMYPTAEAQYAFQPVVPYDKVVLLDKAVHDKCDAIDGLADGLITDPRACPFDPRVDLPICPAGDNPDCFTASQVDVIEEIHKGPSNSAGQIWPGWPYGGESLPFQWAGHPIGGYVIGADNSLNPYSSRHYYLSNETLRYLVYGDPSYDLHAFNFETDVPDTFAAADILDANDPNLASFRSRGGKLIIWVGWSDWAVNPLSTIDYYHRVVAELGGRANVDDFLRLFMLPGVGHGSSLAPDRHGPHTADFLTPLERWVEYGVAPDRIVASGGFVPHRTRPLCPYPQRAQYVGTGSIDDAANFTCVEP